MFPKTKSRETLRFVDFVSGNIEILGKQNSLFPSGSVIKCILLLLLLLLLLNTICFETGSQWSSHNIGLMCS